MLYVGLDIHTKHISICVLSEAGQVTRRSRVRSIEEMLQILKGLPDRFEVCYEASCGYGHFHDLLQPVAARVLVAHPGQLRSPLRGAGFALFQLVETLFDPFQAFEELVELAPIR